MGYPSDLLSSRAVVKPGMYAIIPPEGRVFNVIPGIEGCRMTILCTPKMGAGFVKPLRFLLYKQRYIPHPDPAMQPYAVFGNTNDIEERIYDNMENVFVRDLLPVDERFDMNMHILSFAPGGCHPFVETHVQEHGAYLYEGEGLYLLNDDWVPVKAEDFIWMGAYCKQCCYGVGLTRLSYIYSKDCHRDAEI